VLAVIVQFVLSSLGRRLSLLKVLHNPTQFYHLDADAMTFEAIDNLSGYTNIVFGASCGFQQRFSLKESGLR
jgi:hypothetical protein